ncbi:MAG: hypothetical protein IPN17_38480 [Deltaproteobacteria bacterium]|nr:hypothetical protein [Deltaproteobacteria bacterium]
MLGGAPSDSASRFGGAADPARAPSIVYPEDGTVLPPNLTGFEVHFRPGAGPYLFGVAPRRPRGARVFTCCTVVADGACSASTSPLRRARPRGAALGDVALTVRATSAAYGGVGRSATRSLGVTNFDVRGGLYYWAASQRQHQPLRVRPRGRAHRPLPARRPDQLRRLPRSLPRRLRIMAGRFIRPPRPRPSST